MNDQNALSIVSSPSFRYGYIEKQLNNDFEGQKIMSKLSLDDLFLGIVSVLRSNIEPDPCLAIYCDDASTSCPNLAAFQAFAANYSNDKISNELVSLMKNLGYSAVDINKLGWKAVSCKSQTQDYELVLRLQDYFPGGLKKENVKKLGSLLRWLFVHR